MLVAAAVLLVAASPDPTAMPGPPCPSPVPPRPEARHASGIALPTPLPRCYGPPVYEPLAGAYSNAWLLAESHPNDFGYPWDDRAKRELVISVTGPNGEAVARAWMASGATFTAHSGVKSEYLAPPTVSVRFRTVTRSFAQLARLQEDIGNTLPGLPDVGAVRSWGHDDEYNRITIDVQYFSDAFAYALAARFGTEAVAIRVDPTYGPFTNIGLALDTGKVDPLLVGVLLAGSALGVGLVVLIMRRRDGAR